MGGGVLQVCASLRLHPCARDVQMEGCNALRRLVKNESHSQAVDVQLLFDAASNCARSMGVIGMVWRPGQHVGARGGQGADSDVW